MEGGLVSLSPWQREPLKLPSISRTICVKCNIDSLDTGQPITKPKPRIIPVTPAVINLRNDKKLTEEGSQFILLKR